MTIKKETLAIIMTVTIAVGFCGTAKAASVPSMEPEITVYHHLFVAGGPIVWFILLPMSVAVVYLVIDMGLGIRSKRLLPAELTTEMATYAARHGLAGLVERFSRRPALISRAVIGALQRSQKMHSGTSSVRQFAAELLQEIGQSLLRKAEWCQIIGSVAPMVGLFGTVYGMIQAFNLLSISEGQPAYDQLAGAISVALVTTLWGLLVAIPALFFYSIFRSRIEAYIGEAAVETDILLGQLFKIQVTANKALAAKTVSSSNEKIKSSHVNTAREAAPEHIQEVPPIAEPPHF